MRGRMRIERPRTQVASADIYIHTLLSSGKRPWMDDSYNVTYDADNIFESRLVLRRIGGHGGGQSFVFAGSHLSAECALDFVADTCRTYGVSEINPESVEFHHV